MKRTRAAELMILIGIILIAASPVFLFLGAPSLGSVLVAIFMGRMAGEAVVPMIVGIWSLVMSMSGAYVGVALIAVGAYVRLQSMSAPVVAATHVCPQCGRSNAPANKFCDKCGAKLSTEGS